MHAFSQATASFNTKSMVRISFMLFLFLCSAFAFAGPTPDDKSKSANYTPDFHGLEKQYRLFLDSYNSGVTDVAELTSRLEVFRLPDEEGWLTHYFGSEETNHLKEDYDRRLATYEKSIPTIMSRLWGKGTHFQVECRPYSSKSDSKSRAAPNPNLPAPLSDVPAQWYEVTFTADNLGSRGGRSLSQVISVVYVDGAARFLIEGAFPFWSNPDEPREGKPTAP